MPPIGCLLLSSSSRAALGGIGFDLSIQISITSWFGLTVVRLCLLCLPHVSLHRLLLRTEA
eukprot:NODE_3943_length_388_cov_1.454277_g3503_i0.p2 GENE.NODE_3943_length_388_cov_1.454277_g3503_i0~~NODE_3943_length_388_cov_1.454277_g3503_i0.p2  ORF type:complete len:61 (+),score=9.17 NODE_3943_length_388_cov_1.454277_g3503_i0:84-266(+)